MEKLFVGAVVSSLIALLGRNRKIGYGWSFLICMCLSPLIGLIVILCSKRIKKVDFIEGSTEQNSTQSNITNNKED